MNEPQYKPITGMINVNDIQEILENNRYYQEEIERLKEELTILVKDDERSQEIIINLGKENEELKKCNKELEEGFKAITEELCETTEELEEAYERIKGLEVASSKLDYESTIYANRIDKAIEYIENDMPYLEEPDEEFERCDGTTYMTMKEYDTSVLLNILKGSDKE